MSAAQFGLPPNCFLGREKRNEVNIGLPGINSDHRISILPTPFSDIYPHSGAARTHASFLRRAEIDFLCLSREIHSAKPGKWAAPRFHPGNAPDLTRVAAYMCDNGLERGLMACPAVDKVLLCISYAGFKSSLSHPYTKVISITNEILVVFVFVRHSAKEREREGKRWNFSEGESKAPQPGSNNVVKYAWITNNELFCSQGDT